MNILVLIKSSLAGHIVKNWAKSRVVRDVLLAQTTNYHNVKPKQVVVLAMGIFIKAIYTSNNYAGQDGKEKRRKLCKK